MGFTGGDAESLLDDSRLKEQKNKEGVLTNPLNLTVLPRSSGQERRKA